MFRLILPPYKVFYLKLFKVYEKKNNNNPVKDHQLTLMWKTLKEYNNNTLLRTARILRRVLETWGDLLSLKLQWKTIS